MIMLPHCLITDFHSVEWYLLISKHKSTATLFPSFKLDAKLRNYKKYFAQWLWGWGGVPANQSGSKALIQCTFTQKQVQWDLLPVCVNSIIVSGSLNSE